MLKGGKGYGNKIAEVRRMGVTGGPQHEILNNIVEVGFMEMQRLSKDLKIFRLREQKDGVATN